VSGWRVYILRCRDGSLYTGATNDLERRLARHADGSGARYTRSRLPVRLVYDEPARDRGAALRREAALKRLTRVEKLALVASFDSAPLRGATLRMNGSGKRGADVGGEVGSGSRPRATTRSP
jgi:putative endonuclease